MSTDVTSFIDDLDAGVFQDKLSKALSDVAAGVIDHSRTGKVTICFDLKQIGQSHQVAITHKLSYVRPTARGKLSEENTTQTPMYVGKGGSLTLFPEGQGQMFDKKGGINEKA
jgi:hypothetical protein